MSEAEAPNDIGNEEEVDQEDDEVMVIENGMNGAGPSRARKRQRNASVDFALDDDYLVMSTRIRQLEEENRALQRERDRFKERADVHEPARQTSSVHSHSFEMDTAFVDFSRCRTDAIEIEGFTMQLHIEERVSASDHLGFPGSPVSIIYPRIAPIELLPSEEDPSVSTFKPPVAKHVLVLFTITQRGRRNKSHVVSASTTVNRLMAIPGRAFKGPEVAFVPTEDLARSNLNVHITAYVTDAEAPGGGNDQKTITIKDEADPMSMKSIHVSAAYLSMWSKYFGAYFEADMKEAKSGIYPVTDDNISSDEFQEMLFVIYPTDKAIDSQNYKSLLKLANRFEMPALIRKVENFMINFSAHSIEKAELFRLATDAYELPMVQATLLHRWKDADLMQNEMLRSDIYEDLQPATQNMVNKRFAEASINSTAPSTQPFKPKGGNYTSVYVQSSDDDDDL